MTAQMRCCDVPMQQRQETALAAGTQSLDVADEAGTPPSPSRGALLLRSPAATLRGRSAGQQPPHVALNLNLRTMHATRISERRLHSTCSQGECVKGCCHLGGELLVKLLLTLRLSVRSLLPLAQEPGLLLLQLPAASGRRVRAEHRRALAALHCCL